MSVMPIPEIIDEIDAYVSRLRQAREILLDRSTEAPQTRVPRGKRKARARQDEPVLSGKTWAAKNKSRSNHPAAHLNRETERVDVAAQVPSSVMQDGSDPEQPATAQPELILAPSVVIKRFPSKGQRTSVRSMRHRTPKPAPEKPDAARPAIALGRPVNSKIVVVPAEQVRREREQAAQPEVRRARVPASGLTGRLAFEALFK